MRVSKCFSYEGNFIYLLFGDNKAIMLDTGGSPNPVTPFNHGKTHPVRQTVDAIVEQRRRGGGTDVDLIVAHTHSRNDHGGDGGFQMTATALSTMVQFRRKPIVVILGSGIYGFEQFLLDASFFNHPAIAPKPYVVLNNWDFAGFAKGLVAVRAKRRHVGHARCALAAAKVFNGPQVDAGRADGRGLGWRRPAAMKSGMA